VEGIAPKLLSSSSFSSGFQQRNDFVGVYAQDTDTFELVNRRLTTSSAYSPLLSWQANWKNKINTAFSTNYTKSRSLTYFEADRATSNQSENRSYSLTLGYSFSAPQGIRFPGLKKVRFSSDLDVSLGLTYGSSLASVTGLDGETVISENNRDWGTSLSFSYRFSRSIEGGLNSGYNAHRNVQRDVNTGTTDLNFWILFKF
jgi:cell surface protein SprA